MAKIKKDILKATQNRNRVYFHRRWKSIVNHENQSKNNIANSPRQSENQKNLSQEHQENGNMESKERLRRWALEYNISKRAISALLKILISFGMDWLPKDSRTLLSTPRYIQMNNLTNGKIWYGVFKNSFVDFYNANFGAC